MPDYNYKDSNIHDDILYYGCRYVNEADYYYWKNSTFDDVKEDYLPILREPLGKAYHLSQE